MKLIIAGGRDIDIEWRGVAAALELSGIIGITEVVCGMARGVDLAGQSWACENDKYVEKFPANWEEYGKAAGPIRNKEMAEYSDELLLIWDGKSKGSANMKKEMNKLGKPVHEIIIKRS